MGRDLKIGEFARRSGSTAKTVRYYELVGLLHEPQRTASGYRLYDEGDVQRLLFIRKAKDLGFSLTDVRETLAIADSQSPPCVHVLALLDKKIEEIDRLLGQLLEFQRELRRLREESAAEAAGGAQEGVLCAIVERGIHARGQQALTWLESQRRQERLHRRIKTDTKGKEAPVPS